MAAESFIAKVAVFHTHLRQVLAFMASQPHTSGLDVQLHFDWPAYKVHRMMRRLIADGFIAQLSERKHKTNNYALLEFDVDRVNKLLPVTKEAWQATRKAEPVPAALPTYSGRRITRDPLATMLMGTGEAPSLAFHRKHHVSP
jgi:hypothetical protein